jgi:tetratricopeptide (TPR) repeat protein
MLDRFGNSRDAREACNVIHACVLKEGVFANAGRLLPLADVAAPFWHFGTWVRGAALYRAGKYAEAIRCFEDGARLYRPRAWDWCFLAMAYHRLGHSVQARRCLAEATRWIEEASSQQQDDLSDTRPAWGDWHERVVYPLLHHEAEALLSQDSPTKSDPADHPVVQKTRTAGRGRP